MMFMCGVCFHAVLSCWVSDTPSGSSMRC